MHISGSKCPNFAKKKLCTLPVAMAQPFYGGIAIHYDFWFVDDVTFAYNGQLVMNWQ